MKIAFISDIHGNIEALGTVLSDIKKMGADKIYCLGDLALGGVEPEKTVQFIKNSNIISIQGNTDKMLVENVEGHKVLSEDSLEYLKNLPIQLKIEFSNLKILLVHGSPRAQDENIPPDQRIEEIEQMLEGIDEDIVFCGHTHLPAGYQTTKSQTVVNVGSVGKPRTIEPLSCWALLDIKDENKKIFEIEHRFV